MPAAFSCAQSGVQACSDRGRFYCHQTLVLLKCRKLLGLEGGPERRVGMFMHQIAMLWCCVQDGSSPVRARSIARMAALKCRWGFPVGSRA